MKLRGDKWRGPVKITQVGNKGNVEIDLGKTRKWIHQNRIKPAETNRGESMFHTHRSLAQNTRMTSIAAKPNENKTEHQNYRTRAGRISRPPIRLGIETQPN